MDDLSMRNRTGKIFVIDRIYMDNEKGEVLSYNEIKNDIVYMGGLISLDKKWYRPIQLDGKFADEWYEVRQNDLYDWHCMFSPRDGVSIAVYRELIELVHTTIFERIVLDVETE